MPAAIHLWGTDASVVFPRFRDAIRRQHDNSTLAMVYAIDPPFVRDFFDVLLRGLESGRTVEWSRSYITAR